MAWATSMNVPFEWMIGLCYTRAKRRNHYISFISLASMLVIAVGVMALIVVMSVMNGFQNELRERILGVAAHVQLIATDAGGIKNWQTVRQDLLRLPGVTAVAPYVDAQAMLSSRGRVRGVAVRGVFPDDEKTVSQFAGSMRSGKLDELKADDYRIILGSSLASFLGVDRGDVITLIAPEAEVSIAGLLPRIRQFTVVGIFHMDMHEYDANLALMHLDDAQKLYRIGDGVSGIRLKIADLFAADQITQAIVKSIRVTGYVTNWMHENTSYFRALQLEKTVMFVILSLIILVAAGNLVSSLVMAVTDKEGDIAILRTLGASRRSIMAIFMIQGVLIGSVGLLLGVVSGVALASHIDRIVPAIEKLLGTRFLATDIYYLSELPSKLDWGDVGMVALVSLTLSLLATLYPAWRAASLNPAEALRYE